MKCVMSFFILQKIFAFMRKVNEFMGTPGVAVSKLDAGALELSVAIKVMNYQISFDVYPLFVFADSETSIKKKAELFLLRVHTGGGNLKENEAHP